MLPNFIIIGSPKCGTTSLYHYLKQHNDVYVSHRKEILFFDSSYYKGLRWYERHFRGYQGQKAIGDITPSYLHNPCVPKRIAETLPVAKLICILRNPVERAYSHYWDLVGWGGVNEPFIETLRKPRMYKRGHGHIEFDIFDMGFYFKHIHRYLEYFDKSQIGIFLFDDLINDPVACVNGILTFLGVSPFKQDSVQLEKKNVRRTNRSKTVGNILVNEWFREIVNLAVPPGFVPYFRRIYESLLNANTKPIHTPEMSESDREYLLNAYKDDVVQLQSLLSRDLGQWLHAGSMKDN